MHSTIYQPEEDQPFRDFYRSIMHFPFEHVQRARRLGTCVALGDL